MKPLDHVTILDLSRVLACPFASMVLAELGARVIKVEQPGSGDETRTFEPQLASDSAYYFACNRSKESITVDLRSDAGRQLIRELAQKADVVLENFPVGTLGRYGLDYAVLSSLNPALVYVSCTGFGQSGPYAHKKGYDTVFQAMGGIMSLTGERGGGPVKPGLPVADLTSGLWIAIAILAALAGRTRSGKGCYVDFSMLDGQVALLTLAAARYFALGEIPPRLGTEHPGRVPSASFRCRDGKYAHITASDQHWAPLCQALELDELKSGFDTNEIRVERRDEVMRVLTEAIEKLDRAELITRLDRAEVPVGPVNDVAEILNDPHVRVVEDLGDVVHRADGHFGAIQPCNELGAVKLFDRFGEHAHHFIAAFHPDLICIEPGLQLIELERLAERRPVLVARGDMGVFPVAAAKARGGHAARMLGSEARRDLAEREIARRREREQRHLAVEHREVDVAALAAARASGKRREDGDGDPQTRGEVGDRQAGLHRSASALAGEAHDAAHRLEHGVVALLVRVRAALAEAGARHVDERRVERGKHRVVESVATERADRKILEHDVGLLRELADELPACVRAQVDGDRFLGAVAGEVVGAVACELGLERARLVAASGLLDLDDARAELGEDHRRERAREHAREVEDRHVIQGFHFINFWKLRMRRLVSLPRSSAAASGRSAT